MVIFACILCSHFGVSRICRISWAVISWWSGWALSRFKARLFYVDCEVLSFFLDSLFHHPGLAFDPSVSTQLTEIFLKYKWHLFVPLPLLMLGVNWNDKTTQWYFLVPSLLPLPVFWPFLRDCRTWWAFALCKSLPPISKATPSLYDFSFWACIFLTWFPVMCAVCYLFLYSPTTT